MYYAGIDYHKRYSFISIQDSTGETVLEQNINHAFPEMFQQLLHSCPEPLAVVYESTVNWSWLYEILETIKQVHSITLANPYKVRLIAEAQIKTDKISARVLATLLRWDLIPSCHIPDRQTRDRKEVLRQRSYWVKLRTAVRSRIHKLISQQHGLSMPQVSDLFGKKGRLALEKAVLPEPDHMLLHQNLEMLDTLDAQIKADESVMKKQGSSSPSQLNQWV